MQKTLITVAAFMFELAVPFLIPNRPEVGYAFATMGFLFACKSFVYD